ncbi:MAG: hypothetical protein KC543_08450 [Myxococcales bacterium]|nr:hypothetical protein [Myxococcales bacterium]
MGRRSCGCVVLQRANIASQGDASKLAAAVGGDLKGKRSAVGYVAAIPLAFVDRRISPLTVAIAGFGKTGKSSLFNAIYGEEEA